MLGRIDERTKMILDKLDIHCKRLDNHEERIERLERWKAYVLGAAAVIAFIVSALWR